VPILCSATLLFNERDWGHEELATDPRWVYGLPPRTEPELAWVQHALSRLVPGGAAVVVLPPAAATRKAGRRIRGALLRSGVLRAVIALPPGCAQPHSVSLHLWVLRTGDSGSVSEAVHSVRLIDAAERSRVSSDNGSGHRLGRSSERRSDSFGLQRSTARWRPYPEAPAQVHSVAMPSIDLLDDEVDLTPARHVPDAAGKSSRAMRESWSRFSLLLADLAKSSESLAAIA